MEPVPLISVVMCTFNGAPRLAAQLDSVLAQTHRHVELVAADDGSTDATPAILHSYAAKDPRVRVSINPRTLGYNANFAGAFAGCRGAFIAPCDQDDVWHPQKLEALLATIGPADLAYCDSELVDGAGHSLGRRLSGERQMIQGNDPLALVATNSASGHAQLFRRELLARAQPFPESVHYDWWLAIAAASGNGIRYLDRALVQFRRHDAAATGIGREATRPPVRTWLEGRRLLLRAMARLDSARQADIAALAAALDDGLDHGRWSGALGLAWRHRSPLTAILGPGLPRLAWRALSPP